MTKVDLIYNGKRFPGYRYDVDNHVVIGVRGDALRPFNNKVCVKDVHGRVVNVSLSKLKEQLTQPQVEKDVELIPVTYKGIKFEGYLYDPKAKGIIGPQGAMRISKSGYTNIMIQKTQYNINMNKLHMELTGERDKTIPVGLLPLVIDGVQYSKYLHDPLTSRVYGAKGMLRVYTNGCYTVVNNEGKLKSISFKRLVALDAKRIANIDELVKAFIDSNTKKNDNAMVEKNKFIEEIDKFIILNGVRILSEETILSSLKDELDINTITIDNVEYIEGIELIDNSFIEEQVPKEEQVEAEVAATTLDIDIERYNENDRSEYIRQSKLSNSYVWNTDIETLVKAQTLLDTVNVDVYRRLEEEAYNLMKLHKLSEDSLKELMVQSAATEILAQEHVQNSPFKKEYMTMHTQDVLMDVSASRDTRIISYLIIAWREQFRKQFFKHIFYHDRGASLRGYEALHIQLNTIEQITAAFKLLTDLYGWEG